MAVRDPKDERIATLEKQVSELVDALVKLAGERPVYVPCQLPHYPPAPAVPYGSPVVTTPWITTTVSTRTVANGAASPADYGFVWYDNGVGACAGVVSEPFCHTLA